MESLYFMRNGDANVVKIGIAGDADARRGQFKTGNPEDIRIIDLVDADDARPIETILHRIYYSKRLRREFYSLTPAQADEAGDRARDIRDNYLPLEREAKRLAKSECDSPSRPPTEHECELHRDVVEKREAKYLAEHECDRAENELRVAIGTSEGLDGLASYKTYTISRFDEAAFKLKFPEQHAAFCRPTQQRTLRLLWP
jgi:hypothetical protein